MPGMPQPRSAARRTIIALAMALILAACGQEPAVPGSTPATSAGSPTGRTSSPTAGAPASVVEIPIALPVAIPVVEGGITFATILDRVPEIPELAWGNVQRELEAERSLDLPISLFIGPTTKTTQPQIAGLLRREFRLFSGFSQPARLLAIAYNGKDVEWAEGAWRQAVTALDLPIDPDPYLGDLMAGCDVGRECWGGMTLALTGGDVGVTFYGVQEPFWTAANQDVGPMSQVNHEYTHAVQFAQWRGTGRDPLTARNTAFPCWWQEGQANAIGFGLWASDFATYRPARDYNVTRPLDTSGAKPSLTSFGAASLATFLGQDPERCYHPDAVGDYQFGYSVGFAAVEALIAIGGARATMAVVARTASGDPWAQAFEAVYGTSWEEGRGILAEVLAAEYEAMPLRRN